MRINARLTTISLVATLAAGTLTACGGGSGSDPDTVRVSFKQSMDNNVRIMDNHLARMKKQFEKENPGKKVELVPIKAPDSDYYTKLQQMMRSPKTAPDLVYEDTFMINADITAGLLRPLDEYLDDWPTWDRYIDSAKQAAKAQDGKTYGVPDSTDTRGLWFNKEIFEKAGLPTDWKPRNWEEVLDAARTVRKEVDGVIPLNVLTGKGAGEAASMQGLQMLLYGTGADPVYEPRSKKWVTGSRGMTDALEFVETVFKEKLGPEPSAALDANVQVRVPGEWLPEGKMAIALDGSWLGNNWVEDGGTPWPEWEKVLGQAPMPTRDGQKPGAVSMSGGWTWAIPDKAGNPDLAWEFIETMGKRQNSVDWHVSNAGIAVREDVAEDPEYLKSMPGIDFFTELVEHTHYRPALPAYPQVSTAAQEAMESVTTGDATAREAAKAYDEQVRSITDGAVTGK
ncbi:extracellular solute-binding protein [Streptomyces sp. XM4193]|uniref:extracellular solute-binding protein n=1 Tax=Streptomyces sp. XM4193 TaxID=2929782 RepID=UPI001FF9D893|nr:extracellular solute-binding protein [Streptomyces sp. XM4193]MCK1797552.1 extracellular solute-binding protein [Streptomyces sp. XM4193]